MATDSQASERFEIEREVINVDGKLHPVLYDGGFKPYYRIMVGERPKDRQNLDYEVPGPYFKRVYVWPENPTCEEDEARALSLFPKTNLHLPKGTRLFDNDQDAEIFVHALAKIDNISLAHVGIHSLAGTTRTLISFVRGAYYRDLRSILEDAKDNDGRQTFGRSARSIRYWNAVAETTILGRELGVYRSKHLVLMLVQAHEWYFNRQEQTAHSELAKNIGYVRLWLLRHSPAELKAFANEQARLNRSIWAAQPMNQPQNRVLGLIGQARLRTPKGHLGFESDRDATAFIQAVAQCAGTPTHRVPKRVVERQLLLYLEEAWKNRCLLLPDETQDTDAVSRRTLRDQYCRALLGESQSGMAASLGHRLIRWLLLALMSASRAFARTGKSGRRSDLGEATLKIQQWVTENDPAMIDTFDRNEHPSPNTFTTDHEHRYAQLRGQSLPRKRSAEAIPQLMAGSQRSLPKRFRRNIKE